MSEIETSAVDDILDVLDLPFISKKKKLKILDMVRDEL